MKWEYMVLKVAEPLSSVETALGSLGSDGWELAAITPLRTPVEGGEHPDPVVFLALVLKRPVTP